MDTPRPLWKSPENSTFKPSTQAQYFLHLKMKVVARSTACAKCHQGRPKELPCGHILHAKCCNSHKCLLCGEDIRRTVSSAFGNRNSPVSQKATIGKDGKVYVTETIRGRNGRTTSTAVYNSPASAMLAQAPFTAPARLPMVTARQQMALPYPEPRPRSSRAFFEGRRRSATDLFGSFFGEILENPQALDTLFRF